MASLYGPEEAINVSPSVSKFFRITGNVLDVVSDPTIINDEFLIRLCNMSFKPIISDNDVYNFFQDLFDYNTIIYFLYLTTQSMATALQIYMPSYEKTIDNKLIIEFTNKSDFTIKRSNSVILTNWTEEKLLMSSAVNYLDSIKLVTDRSITYNDPELGTNGWMLPAKETHSLVHHTFYQNYIMKTFDKISQKLKNIKSEYDKFIILMNSIPVYNYIQINTSDQVTAFLTSYVSQTVNQTMQEIQMTNGASFIRYKDVTNKSFANGWSKWRKSDVATIGIKSYILTRGHLDDLPLGTPYGNDDKFSTLVEEILPGNTQTVFTIDINLGGLPESLRLGSYENPKSLSSGEFIVSIIPDDQNKYPLNTRDNPIINQIHGKLEMSYDGSKYFQRWESLSAQSLKWSIEENKARYYYTRTGSLNEDGNKIEWSKWFQIDNIQTYKDLGSFSSVYLKNKFDISNFSIVEIFDLFNQPENTTYTITIFDPLDIISGKPLTFDSHDSVAKWGRGYAQLNGYNYFSQSPSNLRGQIIGTNPNRVIKINSIYFKVTKTKSKFIDSFEFKDLGNYWNVFDLKLNLSKNRYYFSDLLNETDNKESFSNDLYLSDISTNNIYKNGLQPSPLVQERINLARSLIRPFSYNPSKYDFDPNHPLLKFNDVSDDWIYYKSIRKSNQTSISEEWHSIKTELDRLEKRIGYIEFNMGIEYGAIFNGYKLVVNIGQDVSRSFNDWDYSIPANGRIETALKMFDIGHGAMTRYGRSATSLGIFRITNPPSNSGSQIWPASDFWGSGVVDRFLSFINTLEETIRIMESILSGKGSPPPPGIFKIPDWVFTNGKVSSLNKALMGVSMWDCISEFWSQSFANGFMSNILLAILTVLDLIFNFGIFLARIFTDMLCIPLWRWKVCPFYFIGVLILLPFYGMALLLMRFMGVNGFNLNSPPSNVKIYHNNNNIVPVGLNITHSF